MSILRRVMIEERNRLVGKEKRNRAIFERFFDTFPDVKRVFIYVSFGSEVDTRAIIERLLSEGKEVFAPRMFGVDIRFFKVTDLSTLVKNSTGIYEPLGTEEEAIPTESPEDLMILPGVIFDEAGARVGYGMGCYDRYLSDKPCKKCAFSYEIQIQSVPIPLKPTDKTYDVLISEKRLIIPGARA